MIKKTIIESVFSHFPYLFLTGSEALKKQGAWTDRESDDIDFFCPMHDFRAFVNIPSGWKDVTDDVDEYDDNEFVVLTYMVATDQKINIMIPRTQYIPTDHITRKIAYWGPVWKMVHKDTIWQFKFSHAMSGSESAKKHKEDVIKYLQK